MVGDIASHVAFAVGTVGVWLAASFLYGMSQAPRGGFLDALLVAALSGFLYYLVIRFSRCRSMAVVFASLGLPLLVLIGGHVWGYNEAKNYAWEYTHTLSPDRFGPEWKNYDRDENFSHFVGYVTDHPGGGAWAYLRLQSAIGTSESRMGRGGRQSWTVSGLFVWVAWVVHAGFFLLAFMAAAGANAPPDLRATHKS
jgi:hypothetical protein